MNKTSLYTQNFKQELPAILFISTINAWLSFNFPTYTRLSYPLTTIAGVGISILGFIIYSYVFSHAKKVISFLKFEQIDTVLYGDKPKIFMHIIMGLWVPALLLTAWYKNLYHTQNIYYVILCIFYLTFFVLLLRAAKRTPFAQ